MSVKLKLTQNGVVKVFREVLVIHHLRRVGGTKRTIDMLNGIRIEVVRRRPWEWLANF